MFRSGFALLSVAAVVVVVVGGGGGGAGGGKGEGSAAVNHRHSDRYSLLDLL